MDLKPKRKVTAQDLKETVGELEQSMNRLDAAMYADAFGGRVTAQRIEPGPPNTGLEDLRLQCQELKNTVFRQSDLLNKTRRQNAALRTLVKFVLNFHAELKRDAERIMEDSYVK